MNLLAFLFLKVLVSKKTSLLFTLELSSILAACVIGGGGWGVWGSRCRRALTAMWESHSEQAASYQELVQRTSI